MKAAKLRLEVAVEKSARNALKALGLPASGAGVQAAERRYAEESPLYVVLIVLTGRVCRDMYDEHPGHTYYFSDAVRHVAVPPYCPLERAQSIALSALQAAQAEVERDDEEYDGLFVANGITLFDQFGCALQEYAERYLGDGRYLTGWQDSLPEAQEWPVLEAMAKELDSEGSLESSWDNHETGRGLHARAAALRRRIQMARAQGRAIIR